MQQTWTAKGSGSVLFWKMLAHGRLLTDSVVSLAVDIWCVGKLHTQHSLSALSTLRGTRSSWWETKKELRYCTLYCILYYQTYFAVYRYIYIFIYLQQLNVIFTDRCSWTCVCGLKRPRMNEGKLKDFVTLSSSGTFRVTSHRFRLLLPTCCV